MEAKHTTGEWDAWIFGTKYPTTGKAASVQFAACQGITEIARNDSHLAIHVSAENKSAVATAYGNTREEAEANARLIAASPELLEALIQAELTIAALDSLFSAEQTKDVIDRNELTRIRAAVAKARG